MATIGLSPFQYAARLSAFFAAIFFVAGTQLPFLPVWLATRGLSVAEISLVTAVPLFVRIVATPAISFAADALGDRRRVLLALGWAGLGATLALSQAYGLVVVLALVFAKAACSSPVMPLTETLAMSGVRTRGLDYGRMRLWGSISFIVATMAGGAIIGRAGAGAAIWLMVAGALVTALVAHALPREEATPQTAREGTGAPPSRRAALGLVGSPAFLLFLLAAGSVQAAHAVFYTYGVLHWQRLGIGATWAGMLWAIGVIVEIGLFAFSGAAVRTVGAAGLIAAGAAAAVVRWTAMSFDPPLWALMPLQGLHGITFGATHLGAVHYISQTIAPERAGTAQGLYATVTAGVGMGLATLASGPLYARFGGGAYLAMAVLALVGLIACAGLPRRAVATDAG